MLTTRSGYTARLLQAQAAKASELRARILDHGTRRLIDQMPEVQEAKMHVWRMRLLGLLRRRIRTTET